MRGFIETQPVCRSALCGVLERRNRFVDLLCEQSREK